jgi:hypothetical protein
VLEIAVVIPMQQVLIFLREEHNVHVLLGINGILQHSAVHVIAQMIQTLYKLTITTILVNVSVYGVIFGTYQQIPVFPVLLFIIAHLVSLGMKF